MPNAHDFGATNEPRTCLWCGAKLRQNKTWAMVRRSTERSHRTDDIRTPNGTYGWEGNGFFCTLRCGEAFGKAFASMGRRLKPKI